MKNLESQIEELEKMRTTWLLVFLIGFIFWDGFRIVTNHFPENKMVNYATTISLLGWLTWTLGLIQMFRMGYKVKKVKQAAQILNDELVELNRLKSWRIAFITVVLAQLAIMALSLLSFDISGILSAEISIFIAVTVALSAFIYYNKSIANG
ncbi:hypothetical protein [Reichenbachiella versicolor]|uniref:hypothetical protein n=1 Tax=Reichenbachiella versicolor TaxID=1821036 RepID=UPI000D6E82C2|nr:hypothetical protein [Reichenbachiella versicolor]